MSPDFADVSSYCYGNTAAADGFANSILQLKAIELVSRSTRVDVISEAWRRRPSTFVITFLKNLRPLYPDYLLGGK